jgi:hypothetical protein
LDREEQRLRLVQPPSAGEAATRRALSDAFSATARQDDGSSRHDNVFRYLIASAQPTTPSLSRNGGQDVEL